MNARSKIPSEACISTYIHTYIYIHDVYTSLVGKNSKQESKFAGGEGGETARWDVNAKYERGVLANMKGGRKEGERKFSRLSLNFSKSGVS